MATAENAVMLSISDMIDLAIGSPEVGVVDFNMLQTVLHCLAQQLRILTKNVELRGGGVANTVLPQMQRDTGQTINVSEYIVDTGETPPQGFREVAHGPSPPPEDSILVVERVNKNAVSTSSPPSLPVKINKESEKSAGGHSKAVGYDGPAGSAGGPVPVAAPGAGVGPGSAGGPGSTGAPGSSVGPGSAGAPLSTGIQTSAVGPGSGGIQGSAVGPASAGAQESAVGPGPVGGPGSAVGPGSTRAPASTGAPGSTVAGAPETAVGNESAVAPGSTGGPGAVGGPVTTGGPGAARVPSATGGLGAAGAPGSGANGTGAANAASGGPQRLSLVTISKFNVLENTVNDLRDRVYGSMPKNEDILEEVRSQTNLKAITDMWNTLNVQSRLDAAETGIAKLSSLVQDVITDQAKVTNQLSTTSKPVVLASAALPAVLASAATAPSADVPGAVPTSIGSASAAPLAEIERKITILREDVDGLRNAVATVAADVRSGGGIAGTGGGIGGPGRGSATVGGGAAVGIGGAVGAGAGAVGGSAASATGGGADRSGGAVIAPGGRTGANEGADGGTDVPGGASGGTGGFGASGGAADGPGGRIGGGVGGGTGGGGEAAVLGDFVKNAAFECAMTATTGRIEQLQKRINECCGEKPSAAGESGLLQDKVNGMQEQLDYVLKQMGMNASKTANAPQLTPDLVKDLQGLMTLFETVQEMQAKLQQVHETALDLVGEKESRQRHVNTLLEQIEFLKATKMDREDLEDAMANKADVRALNRKVSHDQFEMACDDLAKGLDQAIGKLNMQESLWQQALDDIQREIETKLDKMELTPVKEFFNNKLQRLQDSLKALASLRRDVEAAGVKRRLLRDVNCLSCDAQVVMPMDNVIKGGFKPLPPSLSMKPYLTYELDAIRKTQAANVPQRDMHDWEAIDKQMSQPTKTRVRSGTDKHLCNRYCGGSHTVTTPAQRVARYGHFVKQWGPDVLPLSSGLAAGDDGKMYRIIVENAPTQAGVPDAAIAGGTCTPRTPKEEKKPVKPLVISSECRCLEGDHRS